MTTEEASLSRGSTRPAKGGAAISPQTFLLVFPTGRRRVIGPEGNRERLKAPSRLEKESGG